ncbi:transcription factor TCP12-like [Mangifera indica]|uniref:transcription factor TCP12-like n=1 Tax=Mangifera indica TaxID=29780 RepID=UPI001CF9CC86|nr:transcription factor TCP12-like [Mangifera indica]
MFPSGSNCNPFPFTNQTMLGTENGNPSSSQEHQYHPSPLPLFSEPFLADENELLMTQILSHEPIMFSSSNQEAQSEIEVASPMKVTKRTMRNKISVSSEKNGEKQANPRKRAGKKDRHSKIHTAKGLRDRRMRLSLQIARKFFDLQDTLGFDKASKTIEWLFSKSKAAIKELTETFPGFKKRCGGARSLSSTSESEVVSGLKCSEGALVVREPLMATPREAKNKKSEKAKESREKATARERPIEKMKRSKHCSNEANPKDLEPFGSTSTLPTTQNFGPCGQEMNSFLKVVAEEEAGTCYLPEHEMDPVSVIEKFLGVAPGSSSTFIYAHNIAESSAGNFHQKNALFTGNWDNTNNDGLQYTYCTETNMMELTGNLQVQNPCAIYTINQNDQARKSSSNFMTTTNAHHQNPNSVFMSPSNAHEQNPSSIPMTTSNIDSQSHLLQNQFSSNPNVSNKYYRLN